MKNKKAIVIGIVVLLLIAAAVFFWTQCSKEGDPAGNGTGNQGSANAENKEMKTVDGSNGAGETGTDGEGETGSAQLVENEGDLIITIPEDEESDGF